MLRIVAETGGHSLPKLVPPLSDLSSIATDAPVEKTFSRIRRQGSFQCGAK
jgi:hypothetical protein